MEKLIDAAATLKQGFIEFAASGMGMLCVLASAAMMEVAGDNWVNRALWKSSGMARIWWLFAGFSVLCFYSLFLNSSKIPFGKVLGFYVIFFAMASQAKACYDDRKAPSLMMILGLALIMVGSFILKSQVE